MTRKKKQKKLKKTQNVISSEFRTKFWVNAQDTAVLALLFVY